MKNIYVVAVALFFLTSCCNKTQTPKYSEAEIQYTDSIVAANRQDFDSLSTLADRFYEQKNYYGAEIAYRDLGKLYREHSMFEEAISTQKKGLTIAIDHCDTIQIIQALNNIGTSFRRIGILDEASSYHYQALSYCEQYSDKETFVARKNRVISLNGLGNIHLSLGNNEVADSVFRLALEGEMELGSPIGQAINFANIGAIKESNGEIDSARYYYCMSMEYNRMGHSDLGICLCHNHFGRLYEKDGDYENAINEYKKANEVMSKQCDTWHWLESCISLARVYYLKGDIHTASSYLKSAKDEANKINSLGHLAEIYRLEYRIYEKSDNYKAAFNSLLKSNEYADSVSDDKNMQRMQNIRIQYERNSKLSAINTLQQIHHKEKKIQNYMLVLCLFVIVSAFIIIAFMWYAIRMRTRSQQLVKEMERIKTNFFTNITHEFRTPLTVIRAAAEDIMQRVPKDSEIFRDTIDICIHEQDLLDLINQILDIAKMTANNSTEKTPTLKYGNIVEFISVLCNSYRLYALENGVTLICCPQQEVIETEFIPDYMHKIIRNLISNAVKFSKSGSEVLISVEQKGNNMKIYVSDSGRGMTDEQKKNIFKPFYQASNDSRNIGTGIGLSLVKLMVDAQNGNIEVHSVPMKGSTFIVTLPIKEASDKATKITEDEYPHEETPVRPRQKLLDSFQNNGNDDNMINILIVEDTPEVAHYIAKQFINEYSFIFASDGAEGLAKAELYVPDLIITDIMMPVMDGFELCRRIRASQLLNHIPVIMVTAKVSHEDKIKGLNAGADAYMEKPFRPDELKVRIEKLVEQRKQLREKYSTVTPDTVIEEPVAENNAISESNKAFIAKFTECVNKAMKQGKTDYDELASNMCLSRTQLNRKIKAITGLTTTEQILKLRIQLACKLLDTTDMPIYEIAHACGMDNQTYFGILFKKVTNMTPVQYRERKKQPSTPPPNTKA